MQAARQEALQDRVAAPRHHVHQAPAESAGAAVRLRGARYRAHVRSTVRILRGPAASTRAHVLRDDAASGPMGVPGLLPVRLPRVVALRRTPVRAESDTAVAAETTDRPGRSAVSLRGASLKASPLPRSGRIHRSPVSQGKRALSTNEALFHPRKKKKSNFTPTRTFSRKLLQIRKNFHLALGFAVISKNI